MKGEGRGGEKEMEGRGPRTTEDGAVWKNFRKGNEEMKKVEKLRVLEEAETEKVGKDDALIYGGISCCRLQAT